VDGRAPGTASEKDIARRLGEPDDEKRFLASLMVSLLRAQAVNARRRAESRCEGKA
jgi:hypothetical protein